ncbi:MAG: hypothetical protein ABSC00_06015 [Acidimicrobiales bacterium]
MNFDAAPFLSCPTNGMPVVGAVCNAVGGGVGSAVSGAAGSVLGVSVGAVFDAAGQWVASGAAWLLGQVGHLMSSSTSVGLGTKWFAVRESVMATLAGAVVLPMVFVGAIQAIYRQNAAVLTRAFLVHLPLAMLLTGVAVELVRLALAITDMLSAQVLSAGGVDTRQLLAPVTEFLGASGLATAGAPGFVVFVGALIVAISALTLWLELVVRAAAVAAATLFLPLTLAALVWPAVSHWCRRLADTLAALVLSKFVVAAVLSLAAGAIAGGLGTEGANGGGFAAVVTGIALLLIATLCPFTLLKLVPAVEAGAVAHLESVRHRLAGAARTPASARSFAMDVVALAGSGPATGGAIADGAEVSRAGGTGASQGAGSSDAADPEMNDGRPPPASVSDWFPSADEDRDQTDRSSARSEGHARSASTGGSSRRSSGKPGNRGVGGP